MLTKKKNDRRHCFPLLLFTHTLYIPNLPSVPVAAQLFSGDNYNTTVKFFIYVQQQTHNINKSNNNRPSSKLFRLPFPPSSSSILLLYPQIIL